MGDIWKKVRSGEKLEIPAAAHNAWMDAARAERNRQHDVGQDAGVENRQTTIVKVKNTSGSDLDRFAVLALSDPIITPTDNLQEFKNRPNFKGIAPAAPTKCKTYCILLEPLKNNAIGRGIVAGITPVKVNVIREDDRFAEIEAGTTASLRSVPYGSARILWKESGTGTKWAVVRLGDRARFAIFQLAGTWEAASESSGWMKMAGCKPVFYSTGTYTYAADNSEPVETVWHVTGYPGVSRTNMKAAHMAEGLAPVKYGCGDWVWCVWNDQDCRWQVLGDYEDIWKFELKQTLKCGGYANAQVLVGSQLISLYIQVSDSLKLVANLDGQAAKIGTRGAAKYWADSCQWEVIAIGGECSSPSPSSESPSSGSSSPSSSPSSDSSSPSSSPPPSSSPSSSPPPACDYTGSVTVGTGQLYRSGNSVCEPLVTMVFRDGLLCSVAAAGTSCVDVCNCGSSSSSSVPSSSPSSSPPSSSPSSNPPSSSPSSLPPSSPSPSSPSPSSTPPSSTPPSDSSVSSEPSPPPSPGSSSPSSPVCSGQCAWIAVVDSGSSGGSGSPASDSSGSSSSSSPCICDVYDGFVWESKVNSEKGWYYWSASYGGSQFCPIAGDPAPCAMELPTGQPGSGVTAGTGCVCGCGQAGWYWNANTAQWECVDLCRAGSGCSPVPPTDSGSFHGEWRVTSCE